MSMDKEGTLEDMHMPQKQQLETMKSSLYNKKTHGIPHFVHIGEAVQKRLESSNWKKGDKFGSMDELAEVFGVSRLTVKHALIPFLEKGVLRNVRGKGIFMNQDYEEPPRMNLQTNWESHLRISENSKAHILLNERVDHCPWDTSYFSSIPSSFQHMVRVHEKNGRKYGLIEAYFDAELYELSPRLYSEDTILLAINKLRPGLISDASQTIRIKRADSETAGLLKIPVGDPVAAIRRTIADKSKRMIYLGNIMYPGDKIEIQVELLINKPEEEDEA